MATNAYFVINAKCQSYMFALFIALHGNGAKNACWHFLASQLKIDYKSIISNGTRNVGCWYTITIVTSER